MAVFSVEINIKGGATRTVSVDPEEIPMSFFEDADEARASGRTSLLIRTIGDVFGLTPEERRALTIKQFRQISDALNQAVAVPLASA